MNRFLAHVGMWTVICVTCAVPSFCWVNSASPFDMRAILCGILVFILLYAAVTSTAAFERLLALPFVRRTLYIGFGLRLAISVIFPVGMAVDLVPGIASVLIVEELVAEPEAFLGMFLTTVIQGTLVSLILAAFMGIVYLIQVIFVPEPIPEGHCRTCRYDLTGNVSGVCPECGTPVPCEGKKP